MKAEGANVIVIKMTFPDNENIQGLRAFTPTDPRELDQGIILQWTFQTFSLLLMELFWMKYPGLNVD